MGVRVCIYGGKCGGEWMRADCNYTHWLIIASKRELHCDKKPKDLITYLKIRSHNK